MKTQAPHLSAKEVQLGLGRREFHAYLQPKFDLRTGKVDAAEVLARWHHPFRGVLQPAHFIPLIKHVESLDELLFELLKQGLAFQLKLHSRGRLINLAFNLSLSQLTSGSLVDRLREKLLKHPLPLCTLTFEITEDGPAVVSYSQFEQINRLNDLGVRLSVDDFGTGYSSMLRLCQIPFSEIKLAREFIHRIDESVLCRAVIRNTLALAEELGIQTVMEGIETDVQRTRLIEMGARTGQGFLCARPLSVDKFETWLNDH
ncbi:EAL domain-containing protein [Pseudomonas fluorescens]|nr:EAL domain-containing protein [Pseudomonas fluorescens]